MHYLPSFRRTSTLIALAASLLAATFGVVHAEEPGPQPPPEPGTYRSVVRTADANAQHCITDNGSTQCSDVYVSASEHADTASVCVTIFPRTSGDVSTADGNVQSYESGCGSVPKRKVAIGRQLNKATVAPATITVYTFVCDSPHECAQTEISRTVRVAFRMRGSGAIETFSDTSGGEEGGCTYTSTERRATRPAAGTVTLNGTRLDAAGSLGSQKQTRVIQCP